MKDDPRFIQQHLANERTYLAWIRTSIAIIGLGFLAAGLVLNSESLSRNGHVIAVIGGLGSVLMGGTILGFATRDYFVKRDNINHERFQSPTISVLFVFTSLGIISMLLVVLVMMMVL